MNEFPFITVCMPVYNEALYIKETLDMLLKQEYPKDRFEIIIADGNSEDETVNIIKSFQKNHPQIILKSNDKKRSSSGRTIGFQNGRGDVFVVIDGHCYIPDNKLFLNIKKCLNVSGADCLCRSQPLDPPGINQFQKLVAIARKSYIGHGNDSMIYSNYEGEISPQSNGAIYTRKVIDEIGFVDESFDACEDVEFNVRVEKAGFKSFMSPSLTIKYFPRDNIKSLLSQMMRYGKGRVKLAIKHNDTFSLKGFVPLFFILGLLGFLLSFPTNPTLFAIFVILYGIYGLVLIIFIIVNLRLSKPSLFMKLFFIYFTIHFGLGLGQLIGILSYIVHKMKSVL